MSIQPTTRRFAFALTLAFLASAPATADSYRDFDRLFTIELPNGWQVMTDQEIAQLNKAGVQSIWTPKLMITTAFRQEESRLGNGPYTMITAYDPNTQTSTSSGCSNDYMTQTFARRDDGTINQGTGPFAEIVQRVQIRDLSKTHPLGGGVVDRQRSRIINRYRFPMKDGSTIDQLNVIHQGATTFVTVQSIYRTDQSEQWLPKFIQMNETFRYDEEAAAPTPSEPVPPSFWNELIDNPSNSNTAATLSFVLVGGSLIGIVVCAAVTGLRRARKAAQ